MKTISQTVQLAKALGDETRLRIMNILKSQELCACQIIELFDLANSTISKHLSILKHSGLINSRKSGRWIFYFWSNTQESEIQCTQEWITQITRNSLQARKDHQRICEILKQNPEDLCRKQRTKNDTAGMS